jgi:hypothetical protein
MGFLVLCHYIQNSRTQHTDRLETYLVDLYTYFPFFGTPSTAQNQICIAA